LQHQLSRFLSFFFSVAFISIPLILCNDLSMLHGAMEWSRWHWPKDIGNDAGPIVAVGSRTPFGMALAW
jgi:hypothetical protein